MSQSRVAEEGEVGGWGNSVRVELVPVPAPGSTTRFIPPPPAAPQRILSRGSRAPSRPSCKVSASRAVGEEGGVGVL